MASTYLTTPGDRREHWTHINWPEDIQAAGLEFVGTTAFLLMALGGVQAAAAAVPADPAQQALIQVARVSYIATVFGLSLLVSAWLFFRVTGGLFNPNISLALLLCGAITPFRFILYCIAQLAGGIAAAALVYALTPGPLASRTVLDVNINAAQGVFIEAFLTTILCLSVLMLAAEKHQATPFAPVGVGLTLFACELFGVPYTGGALNVARAFGPAAVTGFQFSKHWVYWVGDGLGSLFAASFYLGLKQVRYWRLNPNQDSINEYKSPGPNVATANRSGDLERGDVVPLRASQSRARGNNIVV